MNVKSKILASLSLSFSPQFCQLFKDRGRLLIVQYVYDPMV